MADRLERYRRAEWFGAKPALKKALAARPLNGVALALLPKGPRWSAFPVNRAEIEGRVGGARFRMLDPLRCSIARELYWGDGERLRPAERFALELFCRLSQEADVGLDIGAHTGIFSLAAAASCPSLRVHAFELVPEIRALLQRNVDANGVAARVACHSTGLGEDGRTIRLPAPGGGSLPLSFSTDWDTAGGREAKLRSLDSLIPLMPSPQARVVAKIDVEGTEDDLLRHGEKFLRAFAPAMICEILPGRANTAFLEPFLRSLGYGFELIGDGSLLPRERLEPSEQHHDWLFRKVS